MIIPNQCTLNQTTQSKVPCDNDNPKPVYSQPDYTIKGTTPADTKQFATNKKLKFNLKLF